MMMSSGVEKLLPFDRLNINEFGVMYMIFIYLAYPEVYRSYRSLIALLSMEKAHIISAGTQLKHS